MGGVEFVEGFVVGFCPGLNTGERVEFAEDWVCARWDCGMGASRGLALELSSGAEAI